MRPARDIFTSSSAMVASLVVLPLIPGCGAPPLGGLYYASHNPVDFAHMQDTLLVGTWGGGGGAEHSRWAGGLARRRFGMDCCAGAPRPRPLHTADCA